MLKRTNVALIQSYSIFQTLIVNKWLSVIKISLEFNENLSKTNSTNPYFKYELILYQEALKKSQIFNLQLITDSIQGN